MPPMPTDDPPGICLSCLRDSAVPEWDMFGTHKFCPHTQTLAIKHSGEWVTWQDISQSAYAVFSTLMRAAAIQISQLQGTIVSLANLVAAQNPVDTSAAMPESGAVDTLDDAGRG